MADRRQYIRDFLETPVQEGIASIRDIEKSDFGAILRYMLPRAAELLQKIEALGLRKTNPGEPGQSSTSS